MTTNTAPLNWLFRSGDQPSNTPRPEVYHTKGCHPVAHPSDNAHVMATEVSVPDTDSPVQAPSCSQENTQEKSDRRDSGCSCDAALEDAAVAPPCDEELPNVFADILLEDTCPDDKVETAEASPGNVEAETTQNESESAAVEETVDNQRSCTNCVQDSGNSAPSKPGNCDLLLAGKGEVTECSGASHIIPIDNVNNADPNMHEPPDGAGATAMNKTGQVDEQAKVSEIEEVITSEVQLSSQATPIATGNGGSPDSVVGGTPNLQIGNIQYFQFDDVTFAIPTTSSKDAARNNCESPAVGSVDSQGSGSILKRTLGSFSSFSSLSPNFNILVDFSSGLFAKNQEYRGPVKDIATVLCEETSTSPVLAPVHEATTALPVAGRGYESVDVRVRNAVRLTDKPDLFRSLDGELIYK